jgi:hypothetical protein
MPDPTDPTDPADPRPHLDTTAITATTPISSTPMPIARMSTPLFALGGSVGTSERGAALERRASFFGCEALFAGAGFATDFAGGSCLAAWRAFAAGGAGAGSEGGACGGFTSISAVCSAADASTRACCCTSAGASEIALGARSGSGGGGFDDRAAGPRPSSPPMRSST